MNAPVSEDTIVQKLDVLTKLIYLLMRTQGMTMRLLIREAKDLAPESRQSLLDSIKKIDDLIETGL